MLQMQPQAVSLCVYFKPDLPMYDSREWIHCSTRVERSHVMASAIVLLSFQSLTSNPSPDLGEDQLVPEGTHTSTSEVPPVQGCFLGGVRGLKQLAADGVTGLDRGCHSVVYSVP